MCKGIGIATFLLGGAGLLLQQWYNSRQRWYFLQEMQASLLRIRQAVAQRNLPMHAILRQESGHGIPVLSDYFAAVLREMQKHKKEDMEPTLWQEMTPDMRRLTKEEERRLFVQALCSLFSACLPRTGGGIWYLLRFFCKVTGEGATNKKRKGKGDGGYDRDGSHAGSGAVTVRICPLNSYLKLQQLVLS